MITAILTAGAERGVDPVAELAILFVNGLVGGAPDHLLTPANPRAADLLIETDLIVVASPVSSGALDTGLRHELERYRHGLQLAGMVAFPLTVGRWPAEGDVAELQLKPLLRAAGAACAAPGLHVSKSLDASAVAAYCQYWRPAVPALVRLANPPSSVTGSDRHGPAFDQRGPERSRTTARGENRATPLDGCLR